MTCRDKLKLEHPEQIDPTSGGGCNGCPSTYGYLPPRDVCTGVNCWDCWNQEIPETDIPTYPLTAEEKETLENIRGNVPIIKDSGNRRQFESGAVRDMQEGKGRCDLMPLEVVAKCLRYDLGNNVEHENEVRIIELIKYFLETGDTTPLVQALYIFPEYDCLATMFLEVAKHFEEGAKKYGENNWQKGIPVNCYIDSAVRHYLKWLRGDKDEPHYRAFVWNLMCCIWEVDYRPKEENSIAGKLAKRYEEAE